MLRQNKAAFLAAAAALALGGCTTVGPNFKPPQAPSEASYAMPGDATTALASDLTGAGPWWRGLGSATLDGLEDAALAGNRTVAQANANLAAAQAAQASVAGSLEPQVDAAAAIQRERINTAAFGFSGIPGLPAFPNPSITLYSVGPSVSYDLDLFGGGRRRLEQASARTEASADRARAAYLSVTGNVALAAVRIAALANRVVALEGIIADDEQTLALVHRAQAAGAEAPSASHVGDAQLALDRAQLPPLTQALDQQRHALSLLLGRPPGSWSAPKFTLADFTAPARVPASVPSELVRRRPDILAAEADLHADTAAIGVAAAARYPSLRLTGSLTQEALSPDKLFSFASTAYAFGPGLTAPIFHGGSLKANQRQAEAEARAALAVYEQTVLTAFGQVADVLSNLGEDDQRLSALELAVSTGEAALADARTAYRLGGGTLVQVTTEQRNLEEARLQLADAQGQKLADIVQLFAATASDWR
ncbi:MAG TPA: efflux transporter outer membrane subunit [Caulobacteraceae bacterium]|nr:efflux transporter outer membrane subunit [Caulobacteraceae bacterium]